MSQEAISFVTPVGRIVWGSVSERATENYDGDSYEPGKGPYQFGLAIRKDHDQTVPAGYNGPTLADMLTKIYQQAMAGYQSNAGIAARIQNEWQSGFAGLNFRFKIKDGDKPNDKGQINENTKGCWVFSLATTLDFKCANAQNVEVDPKQIERGYYTDCHISVKINGKTDATAGVYLNPNVVRLVAFGEKITGGIDAATAFAGVSAPTHLPPGASVAPIGGAMPAASPTLPGATPSAAPALPGGLPGGISSPATASPGSVTPHTGFVNAALPGLPGQ